MKVAVVGSRSIKRLNLGDYMPAGVTGIISGGAVGVDTLAAEYAREAGIPLTEFRPDYERYGRSAPLRRNSRIVAAADVVLAFWDGKSRGTMDTVRKARAAGKPCTVIRIER